MIRRMRLAPPVPGRADQAVAAVPQPWTGKRLFDLVGGSLFLVLLSPLRAIVAVIVRLTTPGPALFRQVRLGQDCRPFVLYKFRTMYDGSASEIHREYVRKVLSDTET